LYGHGWLPAGMPPDQIKVRIQKYREIVAEQGNDFEKMDVALQMMTYIDSTHEKAIDRFKQSQMYQHNISLRKSTLKDQADLDFAELHLVGTADEVIAKASQFSDAGVKHLCGTYFCADTIDELKDQMHLFAEAALPEILKL
jgi:alkanesulfonate monooxygenase SsuD/methylene tetrahydromethanopterin reductase-like flavin-dependent oxidoreductase (luciferase family)